MGGLTGHGWRTARCYVVVVLCGLLMIPYATNAAPAPAVEDSPRFDVWEYQIEGNTRLKTVDIEKIVYPFLGPERTIDDVEAARQALEAAYRDKGHGTVLVELPEQDVDEGLVRLVVIQGAVDRLKVTGSRYFSLKRIRHQVPSLAAGKVPYLPNVQAELKRLNLRSRDRLITPVLRPGRTPGKLEVELKVEDTLPLHASIELNDRYTSSTERLRLNADLRYDNLWQREHSIAVGYQVAPQNQSEVEVFSSTYAFRPFDGDTMLSLYGIKTNSSVNAVGTLGVIGEGSIAGLRASVPLPQSDAYVHNINLGLDYKDFGESIELLGADTFNTPISYTLWSAYYGGTLFGDKSRTQFNAGLNFGLRGFGNTEKEFANKRFLSKPNFIYFVGSISRSQELLYGVELFGGLDAQVADSPLISNEQFAMGGVQSVRGYFESQSFADNGIRGTVELRSPDLGAKIHPALTSLRFHAFIDGATGNIKQALPAQADSFTLWSTGLGLRVISFNDFNASFDWSTPLEDSGTVLRGESRVHFSLGYGF